jgi:hypothetical protein
LTPFFFLARQRRVLRPSLTHFDPVWPFEVAEIIEFTGPPGDLLIRRLQVRIRSADDDSLDDYFYYVTENDSFKIVTRTSPKGY